LWHESFPWHFLKARLVRGQLQLSLGYGKMASTWQLPHVTRLADDVPYQEV